MGDHPRIRGEHQRIIDWLCQDKRIIPAYAGSTPLPRLYMQRCVGSSPHTRGAPHCHDCLRS